MPLSLLFRVSGIIKKQGITISQAEAMKKHKDPCNTVIAFFLRFDNPVTITVIGIRIRPLASLNHVFDKLVMVI
ncbi:MAG: hypothetical protein R2759_06685 [Bacteroidales bacterium]